MPTTSAPSSKHASSRHFSPDITYLLLPVVFILGMAAGYLLWGNRPVVSMATDAPNVSSVTDLPSGTRLNVDAGDNPSIGPDDAPVIIIEFGDYQCPGCKYWHDVYFKQLLAEYSGKIRFVFLDFPLSFHPESLPAAEAADCAGEQDGYWPYHDALFGMKYELGRDAYIQYANDLGLDIEKFTSCLDSHRYQGDVQNNYQYGVSLGVPGTPTFFVNGILVWDQPYEGLKQIIEQELAGQNP